MEQIIALLNNRFFVVPLASWGIAQVLKVIINYCLTRELKWERLFGDGGMPSGHSATVFSMATMAFLSFGADSYQFAIALMVAIIVAHDATGVRLETGKQAVVIKELMRTGKAGGKGCGFRGAGRRLLQRHRIRLPAQTSCLRS